MCVRVCVSLRVRVGLASGHNRKTARADARRGRSRKKGGEVEKKNRAVRSFSHHRFIIFDVIAHQHEDAWRHLFEVCVCG